VTLTLPERVRFSNTAIGSSRLISFVRGSGDPSTSTQPFHPGLDFCRCAGSDDSFGFGDDSSRFLFFPCLSNPLFSISDLELEVVLVEDRGRGILDAVLVAGITSENG
jgi:hypothetical protein